MKRWMMVATVFLVVSAIPLGAQNGGSGESSKPVVVRLILPRPRVCLGATELQYELHLQNGSAQTMKLKSGFVSQYRLLAHSFYDCGLPAAVTGANMDRWPLDTDKVTSLAAQSVEIHDGTLRLDPEFFKKAGVYELTLAYSVRVAPENGHEEWKLIVVESDAFFAVEDCQPGEGASADSPQPGAPHLS